jgi:PAS domain S-box-containing protein
MNQKLRILNLEDSQIDSELIREKLDNEGFECEIVRVESRDAFVSALEQYQFDLILSDYTLPGFDGVSALGIANQKCPEAPFIFVSGTIGEEIAIESLKSGATDYVLKERLSRLAPAVRRTLLEAREKAERKRAEEALRKSEERFKHLVESVTNYIYTVEIRDGKPVSTKHSPGCVTVTGYTSEEFEAAPDLWYQMVYDGDREAVMKLTEAMLAGETVRPIEYRIIHKNGDTHWVRNTYVPRIGQDGGILAYDGLITDITEQKNLEEQLSQAQKLEAVGQLAGGVAHDFNNILSAIIGFAHLTLMKMHEDDPLRHNIERILESSERATSLTQSLLAFSRKHPVNLAVVNLNDLFRKFEKLIFRLLREDIEMKTVWSDDKLPVRADSAQIEQLIMNLITNARDAMPDGGRLIIETKLVELGQEFINEHGYGRAGKFALILVSDTGIGMDEQTKAKIFEPFFTTKETGKGTGLGLSMVYGTVKKHDGFINVYSEPGKGATFKIYLPIIRAADYVREEQESLAVRGGSETILVAEDDASLRKMYLQVLEHFGYMVIEAVDGIDAVARFIENKDKIQLVILDCIMPKMNGREALKKMKAFRPDVKGILMSGYTKDVFSRTELTDDESAFIQKPVSPDELLRKIREVFDR